MISCFKMSLRSFNQRPFLSQRDNPHWLGFQEKGQSTLVKCFASVFALFYNVLFQVFHLYRQTVYWEEFKVLVKITITNHYFHYPQWKSYINRGTQKHYSVSKYSDIEVKYNHSTTLAVMLFSKITSKDGYILTPWPHNGSHVLFKITSSKDDYILTPWHKLAVMFFSNYFIKRWLYSGIFLPSSCGLKTHKKRSLYNFVTLNFWNIVYSHNMPSSNHNGDVGTDPFAAAVEKNTYKFYRFKLPLKCLHLWEFQITPVIQSLKLYITLQYLLNRTDLNTSTITVLFVKNFFTKQTVLSQRI